MADVSRVLLGLGGCVDYELKLTADVLESLIATYNIGAAELTSPSTVANERDLVVSILGYLANGGGGEHFVAAPPVLESFVGRFAHRTTLGGTSVRAGILMSRLGVPSTLHLVSVNEVMRQLLPADSEYFCRDATDTFYPHLIVQYDQGLRVRAGDLDLTAPFPNRLIYVNDPANASLPLADELGERLAKAKVFLISGLNAMRDEGELDRRLAELRSHMRHLPPGAVTYFEDAAYHQQAFSHRVRDALVDTVDVYGLNEDEMRSYLGRPVDLLSPGDVAHALRALRALIPVPTLVVHTKYWALATGEHPDQHADSLDLGVVMAATRYRHGDHFTDQDVERVRRHPRRPEAQAFAAALWAEAGEVVHCVPGFAFDLDNPTTVGLGDTFVGGFLAAIAREET